MSLIEVNHISKYFYQKRKHLFSKREKIVAVDNVSFKVEKGQIVGIVGESGSGKTTIGKMLIKLIPPSEGQIFYDGIEITNLSHNDFRSYCKEIQMVFQNPFSSLNPRMDIRTQLIESIILGTPERRLRELLFTSWYQGREKYSRWESRLNELLYQVNLNPEILSHYPHQISGGEARRIGLARILAINPKVLILDEPVASLDLSIKSNIIRLLLQLKETHQLTYIWISHDLYLLNQIADQILVMFNGKLVEIYQPTDQKRDIIIHHPYTHKLLADSARIADDYCIWKPFPQRNGESDVPERETTFREGCIYHAFCQLYKQNNQPEVCKNLSPTLNVNGEQYVACHFMEHLE
ncbi:MAG: ABC transporter ATP-binding protein [Calditrichaeota bacterium]|nr:MAG: ABC transporter ATP-binding protein [Calditrichota bacterium]